MLRDERRLADPRVFVFNPVHGNWTEAKPYAAAKPDAQHVFATLAEQNQRIIGGVIALPDSLRSEPAATTRASLTEPLAQVSPTSGYLAVDKVEPDNKGSYAVSLPLMLRPSRGPGPSFAVRYSSQGATGVLGRGWDLVVSSINVRGPSPLYNPSYETEDYILDGMDLIALDAQGRDMPPIYKGGPIIPRIVGERLFRLHNNSSGLMVKRVGASPGTYHWQTFDPHSHVTRLYGAALDDKMTPRATPDNGSLRGLIVENGVQRPVVGQWGLTQEFDNQPARSGARYSYSQSEPSHRTCDASWQNACTPALRLDWVEYNLAFGPTGGSVPTSGTTRVVFQWTPRKPERFISDGRLGFFRAQEWWLASIDVLYRPEARNVWLAALKEDARTPGAEYALFARHRFVLTDDNSPTSACMNFDTVLDRYAVDANNGYDQVKAAETQEFRFSYEGQKSGTQGGCERTWPTGTSPEHTGDLPASAVDGRIGFPSQLLKDAGLGRLASRSMLGTSRTEETGASLYVGVGLCCDTSSKDVTVGVKGGTDFTKTEGNSTLVDVTGDGIDDLVFLDGKVLKYCAGVRDPDPAGNHAIDYPPERCGTIEGIDEFAVSSSETQSAGVEFYPGFTTFAGIGVNRSQNDAYVYFTDVDGDGLVDLVAYGQVFYGLGEDRDRKVVRFARKRGLTPPLPGHVDAASLQSHAPPDVRETVRRIETRLAATSRRLRQLDFSQTTVTWEAPLDGVIRITGTLTRGIAKVDPANAGGLDANFGPRQFESLYNAVNAYQHDYIDRREACELWSDEERCHATASNPFEPHYQGASKAEIGFIKTPEPDVQLSLFRRHQIGLGGEVVPCSTAIRLSDTFDLGGIEIEKDCRPEAGTDRQIRVQAGDVVSLTYSVHPHFRQFEKPSYKIAYDKVDDDPLFNLFKQGDPRHLIAGLGCAWKDEGGGDAGTPCLLAKQTRYEYDLHTAALTSSPGSLARLPAGYGRKIGGRFELPAELARDYHVYFDVMAAERPVPAGEHRPDPTDDAQLTWRNVPVPNLLRLYRQDVTSGCATSGNPCVVDIDPPCDPSSTAACNAFEKGSEDNVVATRLSVEHKSDGGASPVRHIDAQLAALTWRIPPHVSVTPWRDAAGPAAPIAVYLPISMGDPDLEYRRVEQGTFANPDNNLEEHDHPGPIDFRDIVSDERDNVRLARTRQTIGLCGFAKEIYGFLDARFTENGQPYTPSYLDYWRNKIDAFKTRCEGAAADLKSRKFADGDRPEAVETNGLRLPELLQALPYAQQITSAETLLERVLHNLALGDALLTDSPRLTRRGYRLPVKVNPLDCETIALLGQPPGKLSGIQLPIVGPDDKPCAFRMSANFAMQDLEDLTDPQSGKALLNDAQIKNMRAILARFARSSEAAFDVELTATSNGEPVRFKELTGEATGNQDCIPRTPRTCIGSYGTTEPIGDYFYSKGNGDAFPRITADQRTGRTVAFSNSVMDRKVATKCPRNFPAYGTLGKMEAKQDCLFPGSDVDESEKFVDDGVYSIHFSIGENNQFRGRNRVLEFKARPFDVLELHVRLAGVTKTIARDPNDPTNTITGTFSVFDAVDGGSPLPMGLMAGRHLLPRSPSQILPGGDIDLRCPLAPHSGTAGGDTSATPPPEWTHTGDLRLWSSCRPWTRLGWTEILLGAQYRTYSDAQKIKPGEPSSTYSIKRRREILRLQPEIEVEADHYVLEADEDRLEGVAGEPGRRALPMAAQLPSFQHRIFDRHDPNVAKVGGDWVLFASKRSQSDASTLAMPPAFVTLPYAKPSTGARRFSLRYDTGTSEQADLGVAKSRYDQVRDACASNDVHGCERQADTAGVDVLSLKDVEIIPLMHRFVGPVPLAVARAAWKSSGAVHPVTGDCAAEIPAAAASCWRGADDTVFLESAIRDTAGALDDAGQPPALYSISALVGFERPPLAEFTFQFNAYTRLACADPEYPNASCPKADMSVPPSSAALPNRPNPPDPDRTLEMFGPVQSSQSSSISRNAGFALANADSSTTDRRTTRLFVDVNGDGFPDVISDGVAELSSPVGLPRRTWWSNYRVDETTPSSLPFLLSGGFEQSGQSSSSGEGIGLSPSTFAQIAKSRSTGSPDPNVEPSFSFNVERGRDNRFTELRDINGDGLLDTITLDIPEQGTLDRKLAVHFNSGGGLSSGTDLFHTAGIKALPFNTTHSSGIGVRLGFSMDAGSLALGAGLAHHDAGARGVLVDFNGDGRPDIVMPVDSGSGEVRDLQVFYNLGNGFSSTPKLYHLKGWNRSPKDKTVDAEVGSSLSETTLLDAGSLLTFGLPVPIIGLKFVFTPGVKWARGQTRELMSIRDLNGDGVPDVVTVSGGFLNNDAGEPETQISYNPEGKSYLLTGIRNPSGSQWLLQHGLYGNSGPENGRPVWALTGVARFNGYDPQLPIRANPLPHVGQDVTLTTYDYDRGYYNRAEHQFYGFGRRTSTVWGCDGSLADKGITGCLQAVQAGHLKLSTLRSVGYHALQAVDQTFANTDFLTQGEELSTLVSGYNSTAAGAADSQPSQAITRTEASYSVDDLTTLLSTGGTGPCSGPTSDHTGAAWTLASFSTNGSALPAAWSQSPPVYGNNGHVFGEGGICGSDVAHCTATLRETMCNAGFYREQKAFWAQQSGSVRQRFVQLETFGPDAKAAPPPTDQVARLRSAIAYDHDQWGQVLAFDSIGEAKADWSPEEGSSVHAAIDYAARQGLADDGSGGYPLLDLAERMQIFAGPWADAAHTSPPLRAREALYSDEGRPSSGNLTDVCLYPGGDNFTFTTPSKPGAPGMCAQFKQSMQKSLHDPYTSMQSALRKAYDETAGLPKGQSVFNAIMHHQLADRDAFGNLLLAISPLSQGREWIERRFSYDQDPFRRTPTTTILTRCVNDVPGAGIDTPSLADDPRKPSCTFGLDKLQEPVQRKAISHASKSRIDTHLGKVVETSDINDNGLLYDFDAWGRLTLVARSWGNAPRENRTFKDRLDHAAVDKNDRPLAPRTWNLLALVDYEAKGPPDCPDKEPGCLPSDSAFLRSNVRRFEAADSYAGLLGDGHTTRETALLSDGVGRPIQSIREADVCLEASSDFFNGTSPKPTDPLPKRCAKTATAIATPSASADALGRELETFESFALASDKARTGSELRFTDLVAPQPEQADAKLKPVTSTTYDGAGRPLLAETRLSQPAVTGDVVGSTQYHYRVVPDEGSRPARFEALTLSPRCTASATWSDARGLKRTVFENQERFFIGPVTPPPALPSGGDYKRDRDLTRGFCAPIDTIASAWATDTDASFQGASAQPSQVSYTYDPLQQLTRVDYPLDGTSRAGIGVHFDMMGRALEVNEPNAGCTRYAYDGLNLLALEAGFRYEPNLDTRCGTSSRVSNEKAYSYAADRLVQMSYKSLEEQGSPADDRDAVRLYYDRSPYATLFGHVLETPRFVPNDQANQRFVDVAGRKCDNCIGQATVVTDRSGARSVSFNELGLPRREVRSIIGPRLKDLEDSGGLSETYLPEIGFYELDTSYTAFGDPVQEKLSERAPMNPASTCVNDGVNICIAQFTIGRRYAPDGAVAQILFNGKPLISAAQDELGRPAVRWTGSGIATGYAYNREDLRLDRMTTLTATGAAVQANGYQYDGASNILSYANRPSTGGTYESSFGFTYDPANRITGFGADAANVKDAVRSVMKATGSYAYDPGHRMTKRDLTITGDANSPYVRHWTYRYGADPAREPLHAPKSIVFKIDDSQPSEALFDYDDLGRMRRIESGAAKSDGDAQPAPKEPPMSLLSNRAMTWDAEGRLIRARGVADGSVPDNDSLLRDDYVYDAGGNRALKISRPIGRLANDLEAREHDVATLYMTPFYARPYDAPGTVELSQGSLPVASLAAPADQNDDPVTTFLYSDLPVGSMTAGVTVFGEPSKSDGNTVIARREYSPYGLELTTDGLADTGREDASPLSAFHGKELDRTTRFSTFGASYYSRDIGLWLKPDVSLASSLGAAGRGSVPHHTNPFEFSHDNPILFSDRNGLDPVLATVGSATTMASPSSFFGSAEFGTIAQHVVSAAERVPVIALSLLFLSIPGDTPQRPNFVLNESKEGSETVPVKDLIPTHSEESSRSKEIEKLSDEELLEAVKNPSDGGKILIKTDTGKVHNGNRRTWELKRRAADPDSIITPETRIPVERYTPEKVIDDLREPNPSQKE